MECLFEKVKLEGKLSVTQDMRKVLLRTNQYDKGISRAILRKIFNRLFGQPLNFKKDAICIIFSK